MSDDKQNQATPALAVAPCSPAVVRTRVHMCLCVSGALRWKDSRLAGLFTKDDGSECTGREAREYLKLQHYLGHRVIPIGDCDNFDYNEGCRGHPEKENNVLASTELSNTRKL